MLNWLSSNSPASRDRELFTWRARVIWNLNNSRWLLRRAGLRIGGGLRQPPLKGPFASNKGFDFAGVRGKREFALEPIFVDFPSQTGGVDRAWPHDDLETI